MGQGALETFTNMIAALNSSPAGSKHYDHGTGDRHLIPASCLSRVSMWTRASIWSSLSARTVALDVGFATLLEHYNPE